MGVMPDVTKTVSMDFKKAGDSIYMVGESFAEVGGSEYLKHRGFIGNSVPKVDAKKSRNTMELLSKATAAGLVRACHDCSDGGLGVALAEMAFAGALGASVALKEVPLGGAFTRDDFVLFSESNCRFLVEVSEDKRREFEGTMKGAKFARIGEVTSSAKVEISGLKGQTVVSAPIGDLKEAWQKPLRW
jgi:phosphoribosylformylglycinamidine synthase